MHDIRIERFSKKLDSGATVTVFREIVYDASEEN